MQPGADLGVDRIEIDDLAAAPRLHMRQRGLHRPPGRPYSRVEGLREHCIGLLLEQHVGGWREGIVDQNVQATELLDCQLDSRFDITLARDVGLDE
ncbi:hypothetical protein D3C71_2073250 [compost metagenome]